MAQVFYPLPVFHFRVEWGGTNLDFSEVSGLSMEVKPISYRGGLMPEYSAIKMPGIPEFSNITLKRGVFAGDNEFFQWISTVKLNDVERRNLTISLLNGNHTPVMTWKVKNAWPTKVEGPSLNATGSEVAIETIELVHEGLTVENNA
ncbi:MAG: phage tail protein [Bacteroidia bacterium]